MANRDIFHNKVDFDWETRTVSPQLQLQTRDRANPREATSQKAQYKSGHKPGFRKDMKTPMKDKLR